MSGHDFERFIAQQLRANGMNATVTPPAGDQGVDIVAITAKGTRLAIQTKQYSTSRVSNKAVQEVHAGRSVYNCSVAIVITNSTFTKQAHELATVVGVHLIACDELTLVLNGTHGIYLL